jgi:hypothetical protein
LQALIREGGQIPDSNYIFIGDFVDRGFNSVETIEYLLCLKGKNFLNESEVPWKHCTAKRQP